MDTAENRAELADYMVKHAERRAETTARNLEETLRSTAEHLLRTADKLREDGTNTTVNTLGEVQGRGADIDRLCALLGERREAAKQVAALVRDLTG